MQPHTPPSNGHHSYNKILSNSHAVNHPGQGKMEDKMEADVTLQHSNVY